MKDPQYRIMTKLATSWSGCGGWHRDLEAIKTSIRTLRTRNPDKRYKIMVLATVDEDDG